MGTLKRETEMESFLRKKEMSSRIVLLACGSFNPPHYLHARIFEVARNYMSKRNRHTVVHGWISPVSDGYGKPGLVGAQHRIEMFDVGTDVDRSIATSIARPTSCNQWSIDGRPRRDLHGCIAHHRLHVACARGHPGAVGSRRSGHNVVRHGSSCAPYGRR